MSNSMTSWWELWVAVTALVLTITLVAWAVYVDEDRLDVAERKLMEQQDRIERADAANRIMSDRLRECRDRLPSEVGR